MLAHASLMGRHGYEIFHSVATVNIENLASRSQTMSRVGIACMLDTISLSPVIVVAAFALFGKIHRAEIVNICTFYMHNFSEHTLACHFERSQSKGIIAAIFQHDTVTSCLFCGIYQLPAFSYVHGSRDFYGYMFAAFHCIRCHLGMSEPVCTDEY